VSDPPCVNVSWISACRFAPPLINDAFMTGRELMILWIGRHQSQRAAARILGVSPQWLSQWLSSGARGADKRTARRLARRTGIPMDALLFKDEDLSELALEAPAPKEASRAPAA